MVRFELSNILVDLYFSEALSGEIHLLLLYLQQQK